MNPISFWPRNFLDLNFFQVQYFFGPKIFSDPKTKFLFDLKFFWIKNFNWTQNIFEPKIFYWLKKILGQEFFGLNHPDQHSTPSGSSVCLRSSTLYFEQRQKYNHTHFIGKVQEWIYKSVCIFRVAVPTRDELCLGC